MCFSTTASFGASAILTVAGVAALRNVETKSQIPFAAIPVIFAFQQFTEGFVWLSLTHLEYNHWQKIPITIFLILAQAVWPFWVPYSFLLIETDEKRKMALKVLLGLGIIVSFFLAYRVLFYPISASITPLHIHYDLHFPYEPFSIVVSIFYFLATIAPPFLAGGKRMTSLGFLNLMSFIVTVVFFENYVISVWCFFGALISYEVFLAMRELNVKPTFPVITANSIS
ncbi:MAG: DUF6629 family protein [Saprospiraceae bacterium]